LGLVVHLAHELVHAAVSQVLGKGVVCVGSRGNQGRDEEVMHADLVVGVEAHVAVDGPGVGGGILGDGHLVVHIDAFI